MTHNSNALDTDAAYKVAGYDGVAWRCLGYVVEHKGEYVFNGWVDEDPDKEENYDWEEWDEVNENMVNMVMIGDDRTFTFDIEDIEVIPDDAYCALCGQIGCTHDGRERE